MAEHVEEFGSSTVHESEVSAASLRTKTKKSKVNWSSIC